MLRIYKTNSFKIITKTILISTDLLKWPIGTFEEIFKVQVKNDIIILKGPNLNLKYFLTDQNE